MNIPIQNIYYLLCYAWDKLEEKNKVAVAAEECHGLADLLAKILINASKILLKRGIDTAYISHIDELSGIKGKIKVSDSLQRHLLSKQRALCEFDTYSPDILTNQILVSTLHSLLSTKGLDRAFKKEIRQILHMLPPIKCIKVMPKHFRQIRLHRHNRFYDFILKVCQLIQENLLPTETDGNFTFMDFTRNRRQMNRLFEAFLFKFYQREQNQFTVKRDRITWNFQTADPISAQHLPTMNTDITLRKPNQKIIIDAKFYQNTMLNHYGKERIHSENLYQIFSYLLNQENPAEAESLSAKGILLYPTITREYDLFYQFQQHPIEIRTVNLNRSWQSIHKRLLRTIGY